MPRANEMFRADSRMMVVFGALTSKPQQLTFEDSLRFVKKVKNCCMNYGPDATNLPDAIRLVGGSMRVVSKTTYASCNLVSQARDYMLYLSLFDILGRMELSQLDAYQQLQLLFRNHPDLCEELEKFRPPVRIKHTSNTIWPWVIVCAVPLVAVSLIPALGNLNPVLWFVQQTIGEKMAT